VVTLAPAAIMRSAILREAASKVMGARGPSCFSRCLSFSFAHICEADMRVSGWRFGSKAKRMHCFSIADETCSSVALSSVRAAMSAIACMAVWSSIWAGGVGDSTSGAVGLGAGAVFRVERPTVRSPSATSSRRTREIRGSEQSAPMACSLIDSSLWARMYSRARSFRV